MVLLLAAEEFVASPLGQLAEAGRLQALSTTGVWRSEHGFWSRDGSRFLNVRRVLHGGLPADVDVYEFDAGGQLRVFIHAERADLRDPRRWQLTEVEERVLDGRVQAVRRVATLEWPSFLQPDQIGILILPPDSLAPSDLLRYVAYLRERGQNADRYELALWQKGIKPLISAALIVMAVPFVFGSLRTTTAGRRMLGATAVGIGFYLANQMVGQLGLLWNLHPAVTTLAPLLLALAVAGWLWRRV
jgi:lipopolysaccharide export system permease protein